MRCLKHALSKVVFGLSIATAASILTAALAAATEFTPLDGHTSSWIEILDSEGSPRAAVLAAAALTHTGQNNDWIGERRRTLLDRAVQMAPDDAWVQWFAAVNSMPIEILSEPALALQRIEPENGAVWLFPFESAKYAHDSTGVTEALARIGASRKFDDHSVTSVIEWMQFLLTHPVPERYLYGDEMDKTTLPLLLAFGRAHALSLWNYFSYDWGCGQPFEANRREACIAAGRLMFTKSNTLSSMRTGASLLRSAGAPDAVEMTRNSDYLVEQYDVLSSAALEDPDKFQLYLADWMQTRNEIQVAKNLLIREGVPLLPPEDWASNPGHYWPQSARYRYR